MDTLADDVRALGTLEARLLDCRRRVGDMCVEGRPPRMSIPVRGTDDDIFICQTIDDALSALAWHSPGVSVARPEGSEPSPTDGSNK
jgi:hypothetical protein